MFRYKLRTLLIVLAIGPPIIAWSPTLYESIVDFKWHEENGSASVIRALQPGKLMVKGRSYGDVKAGDQIMIGLGNRVVVNGKRRWPE
jgi:hypothetical protein